MNVLENLQNAGREPGPDVIYLDRSGLAQAFQQAKIHGFGCVKAAIAKWDPPLKSSKTMLRALRAVLDLAGNPNDMQSAAAAAAAVKAFELVWADNSTSQPPSTPNNCSDGQLFDTLNALNGNKNIAWWVVWDMMARWLNCEPADVRSNTATVLAGVSEPDRYGSGLLRLTVELIPFRGGGPFCPDPSCLGLTDINGDGGVHQSLQNIWRLSGLQGKDFRGRWRIENLTDPAWDLPGFGGFSYPAEITGRSFEAAALCALLAASGDPYDTNSRGNHPVDELDQSVAISAAVEQKGNGVMHYELGEVTSRADKLTTALTRALSTVVFSPANYSELESSSGNSIFQKREDPDYLGIRIYSVQTVEEALDHLLLANRYHRQYQEGTRTAWLKEWEVNTGRFDFEPRAVEGDPDFENKPKNNAGDS